MGYSTTTSPQVLIPLPTLKVETISVGAVEGFSGIITGIATTTTSGNPAIEFKLFNEDTEFGNTLEVGYPFFVSNSITGTGVTSLTGAGVIIGIGTTSVDNIYEVAEVSISPNNNKVGIVTCRVSSSDVGITTNTEIPVYGNFSWGRFFTLTRASSAQSYSINGNTVSGLSTYPQIQRRGYGLNDSGAYSN